MPIPEEIRRALEQAKQQGQLAPQAYEFVTKNFDAIRFAVVAAVIIFFVSTSLGQFSEWLGLFSLLAGALIAWQIWRKRQIGSSQTPRPMADIEPRRREPKIFGGETQMGAARPWITAHPVGILLALGVGALLWFGVPETRAFVLGALAGGVILAILQALFRYWSR
jgi:hypothetical protein